MITSLTMYVKVPLQIELIPWPTVSIKAILLPGMSSFSSVNWRTYPDETRAILGDGAISVLSRFVFPA